MTPITGGNLGDNILMGASFGAFGAAVSLTFNGTNPVSQKSDAEAHGVVGGSDGPGTLLVSGADHPEALQAGAQAIADGPPSAATFIRSMQATDIQLEFDGNKVSVRTEFGHVLDSYPAVTGNREIAGWADAQRGGPAPPGTYHFDKNGVVVNQTTELLLEATSLPNWSRQYQMAAEVLNFTAVASAPRALT